jgi:phytoene synthase
MTAAPSDNTVDLVDYASNSIAAGSKSFGLASKLFPSSIREDAVLLYAWCRHADDLIDGQDFGMAQNPDYRIGQRERLEELRHQTARALSGRNIEDPAFAALAQVVRRNQIPLQHPEELLTGFAMDVANRRYKVLPDTLDYCYHVAGVVGVMMAMIMGVRSADTLDRASDLGLAFQLTNISRDIIEDAEAGRCYLPEDLLLKVGCQPEEAGNPANRQAVFDVAQELLKAAEDYYASSYWGLPALDWRSAWAIASAARIYRQIGRKLLRKGPSAWQTRISTSTVSKCGLVILALGDVVWSRFHKHQDAPQRIELYQRP